MEVYVNGRYMWTMEMDAARAVMRDRVAYNTMHRNLISRARAELDRAVVVDTG